MGFEPGVGSFLIDRYVFERYGGTRGVQWLVYRREPGQRWKIVRVCQSRQEAAECVRNPPVPTSEAGGQSDARSFPTSTTKPRTFRK